MAAPDSPEFNSISYGWPLMQGLVWEPEPLPPPRWRLALGLFLITAATTTAVGARLAYNFARNLPPWSSNTDLFPFLWAWHHPALLWAGFAFSLPLMAILLAHEMGHYLACRRYRVDSSLPMFLPAPTLIGTMGAFIRIKSRFRSPRELFDIGISGPLAGMVLTLPFLVAGLLQSHLLRGTMAQAWSQASLVELGHSWLESWLLRIMGLGGRGTVVALSPLACAAWVGLLVTMLNLLPAAQLDGGHIVYALSARLHAVTSWATLALLLVAGWFTWPGWYVFAAFIALMRVRHPYVPPVERLGWVRVLLAVLALVVFLAAFSLTPVLA